MKGSVFEREICKALGRWWTDGERDDIFWRTAGSGARATCRFRKGQSTAGQYGDVSAIDSIGEPLLQVFSIELKRGYSANSFGDMFDFPAKAKKQKWEVFYSQAKASAEASGARYWMLIWRRDRRKAMVFMPLEVMMEVVFSGSGPESFSSFPNISAAVPLYGDKMVEVSCCAFEDFLKLVKPQHIMKIWKESQVRKERSNEIHSKRIRKNETEDTKLSGA
jgi:hypothetical protein